MEVNYVGSREARANLPSLISAARPTIITLQGQPRAILLPIDDPAPATKRAAAREQSRLGKAARRVCSQAHAAPLTRR